MDSLTLAASSISLAPFKLFVLFTSKEDIRDAKWAFVFCALAPPRASCCAVCCAVVGNQEACFWGPALCFQPKVTPPCLFRCCQQPACVPRQEAAFSLADSLCTAAALWWPPPLKCHFSKDVKPALIVKWRQGRVQPSESPHWRSSKRKLKNIGKVLERSFEENGSFCSGFL